MRSPLELCERGAGQQFGLRDEQDDGRCFALAKPAESRAQKRLWAGDLGLFFRNEKTSPSIRIPHASRIGGLLLSFGKSGIRTHGTETVLTLSRRAPSAAQSSFQKRWASLPKNGMKSNDFKWLDQRCKTASFVLSNVPYEIP